MPTWLDQIESTLFVEDNGLSGPKGPINANRNQQLRWDSYRNFHKLYSCGEAETQFATIP